MKEKLTALRDAWCGLNAEDRFAIVVASAAAVAVVGIHTGIMIADLRHGRAMDLALLEEWKKN